MRRSVAFVSLCLLLSFILAANELYMWGINEESAFGMPDIQISTTPVKIDPPYIDGSVASIASGITHTVFSTNNGDVYTVGTAYQGQLADGAESSTTYSPKKIARSYFANKSIGKVAAGVSHALAVSSDKASIFAWGFGGIGDGSTVVRTTPVAVNMAPFAGRTIQQVVAGEQFTAALTNDGKVFTWGENAGGQLGDGTFVNKLIPTMLNIPKTITFIAAGYFHMVAIASDNTVYMWGKCEGIEGPNGCTNNINTPTVMSTASMGTCSVIQAAAGAFHTTFLCSDKTLYVVGDYSGSQLSFTTTPVAVDLTNLNTDGKIVESITAAASGTYILTTDGAIYAFGTNMFYLGDINQSMQSDVPIAVDMTAVGSNIIVSLSASKDSSIFALTSTGNVFAWGGNDYGQFGNGNNVFFGSPYDTLTMRWHGPVYQVATGELFTLLLTSPYEVHAMGLNTYGQLGDGTYSQRYTPVKVDVSALNGKKISKLSAGNQHSMILDESGNVYTWGNNQFGQLGDGGMTLQVLTPTKIAFPQGVVIAAIEAGHRTSFAISTTGVLYAWGSSMNIGLLGDPTVSMSVVPRAINVAGKKISQVRASDQATFALTTDGKVYGWGANVAGLLGDGSAFGNVRTTPGLIDMTPMNGAPVTQIACYRHCLATTNNGKLYAWGSNFRANIGDGTSAGMGGSVGQWTSPNNRRTPVEIVIPNKQVSLISVGYYTSIAATTDGAIYTWGRAEAIKGSNTFDVAVPTLTNTASISGQIASVHGAGSYFAVRTQ